MIFHLNILVFQTNGKQPYSFPALSRFWSGLFHIRNDNHAFVVKTPSGMSTALLSYRTINLEELSIKLRNWNLFWFATFPNKQMPRRKRGINSHSSTNRFLLSILRFKTRHILLFEILNFFLNTISEHKLATSLPCDGISFAISLSSWLANTW